MMYAYEIQARTKAGLVLCGQDSDGDFEWLGNSREWDTAKRYEHWLDNYGRLPHDENGYREIEPTIFKR